MLSGLIQSLANPRAKPAGGWEAVGISNLYGTAAVRGIGLQGTGDDMGKAARASSAESLSPEENTVREAAEALLTNFVLPAKTTGM